MVVATQLTALPTGFEPAISTVTGWRTLQAVLREREAIIDPLDCEQSMSINRVAREGVEPTKSPVSKTGRFTGLRTAPCSFWSSSFVIQVGGVKGTGVKVTGVKVTGVDQPGNRTPIFCLQNRRLPIRRAARSCD